MSFFSVVVPIVKKLTASPIFWAFVIAAALLMSIRPYVVTGPSMRPAFEPDDRVLVERLSPKLGLLGRSDTIVFPDPRDPAHPITVKRIVGLPNETIRVEATRVIVTKPDGSQEIFEHNTLLGGIDNGDGPQETKLGPEDYFVMGDNREESTDSRDWGTIQPHEMIGSPFLRLLPLSRFTFLP